MFGWELVVKPFLPPCKQAGSSCAASTSSTIRPRTSSNSSLMVNIGDAETADLDLLVTFQFHDFLGRPNP